jgi:predicted ATPase/DNA-binding SARP family transcriptional activator
VDFRILGSVEVADGGVPRDLGGLRERTLLARLLLSAGQIVSADRLAEDLWSGNPPPHCMATLRVYISRLRRALGPDSGALLTQPPGYRIVVSPGQLDADRFDELVTAGRDELAAGRPVVAAARLRDALALWRGGPLSDVADFAFAQAEVVRLNEAKLAAAENLVEADLACGRHAALTSQLDGLVATYPLRERLCGQRMLALYRCGRQAEALQAYQELRVRLADELGIDPNPSLHRLQEAILRQEPGLDWTPPPQETEPGGRSEASPAAARGSGAGGAGSPGTAPGASRTGAADAADRTDADRTDADRTDAGRADEMAGTPGAAGSAGGVSAADVMDVASAGQAAGFPAASARPAGSRLPAETTSFIGRESELATIEDLLGLSRLLTLTGPSGSGKTRLALRAGAQAADRFSDGVWLIELAPVTSQDLVTAVAASALSVREEPGRPLSESIAAQLRDGEALLIIDNCEHVLDAAGELIATLLRSCPALRVLATSQSRLGLSGEASWPVPPLILPDPAATDPQVVAKAEAVRLLRDRAALARPGFTLTAQNAAAVSEICRRLDGIPLALELAAARLNALSAGQLAARIDDRFRLLAGRGRGGLPRHRTLQAAIEWSHDLLSETEQICFRRLAVFSGGCTLEAAEAVCPGGALSAEEIFETVTALVDRSLLTTEERCGSMRYGMLESIHQFARTQLERAGESAGLSRRHLDWLLDYARQAELEGPDQGAWLDLLETDLENFRSGLEGSPAGRLPAPGEAGRDAGAAGAPGAAAGPPDGRADAKRRLELAGLLATFWMVRGHIGLGRRWLESALAAAGPDAEPRLRAAALDGLGQVASVQADFDAQRACQQESLAIWRSLGDDAQVARCLGDLGSAAHIRGEYTEALAMYTEALELADRAGDAQLMARCLSGLGRLALHQDDLALATDYYTESMARFNQIGDLRRATLILGNLGVVALNQAEFDLARTRFAEHLGNARKLGDRKLIGGALTNLGMVAYNTGDLDNAARMHGEAIALSEQVGDPRLASVALTNLGLVALARKDYQAARHHLLRSLDLIAAVGERRAVAETLEELAGVDAAAGEMERAAVMLGAAQALRTAIGAPVPAPDLARISDAVAAVRTALGEERFGAAQASGAALSSAQAIMLARAEVGQAVTPDAQAGLAGVSALAADGADGPGRATGPALATAEAAPVAGAAAGAEAGPAT